MFDIFKDNKKLYIYIYIKHLLMHPLTFSYLLLVILSCRYSDPPNQKPWCNFCSCLKRGWYICERFCALAHETCFFSFSQLLHEHLIDAFVFGSILLLHMFESNGPGHPHPIQSTIFDNKLGCFNYISNSQNGTPRS